MRTSFFTLPLILFLFSAGYVFAADIIRNDTIKVIATSTPPVIDGIGDDDCWQNATWRLIDQVWIEYGETLDPADFSGRFKIVWSPLTNLLYFLVEIIDDVFVDGYVYDSDPSVGGGYHNYDILEVFIDQDKSGGLYVFDGTGETGHEWGTNARNAFAYHIVANAPGDGRVTYDKVVCDIAGSSWSDYYIANYADHFPEFALRQSGDKYIWEFSLKVYDDTYDPSNPEASRVTLKEGDVMGLTVAYCDNDDPDEEPKQRDNFIGSVWVPEEAYNDHWMNADYFGTVQLIGQPTDVEKKD